MISPAGERTTKAAKFEVFLSFTPENDSHLHHDAGRIAGFFQLQHPAAGDDEVLFEARGKFEIFVAVGMKVQKRRVGMI